MSRMDSNARSGGTYRVNTYYFKIIFFSAPFSFTAQTPKETNKNVVHPTPNTHCPPTCSIENYPRDLNFFFHQVFFFSSLKVKEKLPSLKQDDNYYF